MIEHDADGAAAAIGAELHRLVPAVHLAAGPHGAPVLAPVRPHGGFLIDLRTVLLHGAVPMPAVLAIHRYHLPGVATAVDSLADGGWLVVRGDALLATDRCRALLASLMAVLDQVCESLWGTPSALLSTADMLVAGARGTSAGAAFDPLADAGHPAGGPVAARLFTALCALRYHRADAHAAAWAAEGLTVDEVRALAEDHPLRLRIEAATNRVAARPYHPPAVRAAFLAALRTLPGQRTPPGKPPGALPDVPPG